MNMKRFLPVGILVCVLLALSACGGSKSTPSTDLKVELSDFKFTPDNFTVPAGKDITIQLNNVGAVEHEFIIMKKGTEVSAPFNEDDKANVFWMTKLGIGDSQAQTFTAPSEPGEYQISCGTPGHHEAGMIGKLIVVQ